MALRTLTARSVATAPRRAGVAISGVKSTTHRAFFSSIPQTQKKPTYSETQIARGRPVSPHVTIYAFPVVAISSITVRITGMLLTAGVSGVAGLSLVHPELAAGVLTDIGNSAIGPAAKFCVAFPLIYHWFGGLRHTVWDKMPEYVNNQAVEKSSYAVFAAGVGGALGAAAYTASEPVTKETPK